MTVISTVGELEELPELSVVLDRKGGAWQKKSGEWYHPGESWWESEHLLGLQPLTLIHRPDGEPVAATQPVEIVCRDRVGLVIDSGIRSKRDLLGILPQPVAEMLADYVLEEPRTAAAFRLLATVDDPGWQAAVRRERIDAGALYSWVRSKMPSNRGRQLATAALAFLEVEDMHLSVVAVARRLDDETDFVALVDALRIAREGLAS